MPLAFQTPSASLTPDQVLGFVLLDLVVILVVARAMGAMFKRVGQPTVVGEIVGGILLGPTLLGRTVFAWDTTVELPALRQGARRQRRRPQHHRLPVPAAVPFDAVDPRPARAGVLHVPRRSRARLGSVEGQGPQDRHRRVRSCGSSDRSRVRHQRPTVQQGFRGGLRIARQPSQLSFTLFLAAMLTVTRVPGDGPDPPGEGHDRQLHGFGRRGGRAIVTVLMFLTVAVAAGVASDQGPSSLAVKFAAAGVYVVVLFVVVRPMLAPLGRAYERAGGLTPGLFAVVLIVLLASSYVSHVIGINVIVGGFLAGAVLPACQGLSVTWHPTVRRHGRAAPSRVPRLLRPQHRFHGPGDRPPAGHRPVPRGGGGGEMVGIRRVRRVAGLSWQQGNVLGILMNCRGLLVLVVALIGVNQGVLSAPMQIGGVVMALITTMMTGPLFDVFARSVAEPGIEAVGPSAPGSVLVGIDDLEDGPALVDAAFGLASVHPSSEVVVARFLRLSRYDEIGVGVSEELHEIERSLRALRVLSGFARRGCR